MLLKDALTATERSLLLNNIPVSFMSDLIRRNDSFYLDSKEVAKGYYVRSANKTVFSKIKDYEYTKDRFFLPLKYDDNDVIAFDINSSLSILLNVDDIILIEFFDSVDGAICEVNITLLDDEYDIIDQTSIYPNYNITSKHIKEINHNCKYIRISLINPVINVPISFSGADRFIKNFSIISKYNWSEISSLIRNTFLNKWNSVYSTLTAKYDVTKPIDITEKKTGEDRHNIVKNSTDTFSFDNRKDTIGTEFNNRKDTDTEYYSDDYEYKIEDNNTRKTSEKTSENDYIYGFNSSSKVASNSSEIVGNIDDNVTQDDGGSKTTIIGDKIIDREKTGTETHTNEKTGSETHTINDITADTIDYGTSTTKKGSNAPITETVIKELDFRDKTIFVNMIYADIDSILTLPIYS